MMMDAHNAMVVQRMVEAMWNQGNLEVANRLFSANYVNHAGLIPDCIRGPEAMKVSVALYRAAFPDLQISIEQLTAKQNTVVLRWIARTSSVFSETQGTLLGLMICRFDQGQIAESWMQWDQPGVLDQLGLTRWAGPSGRDTTPTA
jgi:predicted SnoaL-like aldol condensation-catalyzing enzyme